MWLCGLFRVWFYSFHAMAGRVPVRWYRIGDFRAGGMRRGHRYGIRHLSCHRIKSVEVLIISYQYLKFTFLDQRSFSAVIDPGRRYGARHPPSVRRLSSDDTWTAAVRELDVFFFCRRRMMRLREYPRRNRACKLPLSERLKPRLIR